MTRFIAFLCHEYPKIDENYLTEVYRRLREVPDPVLDLAREDIAAEGVKLLHRCPRRPVIECFEELAAAGMSVRPALQALGMNCYDFEEPKI